MQNATQAPQITLKTIKHETAHGAMHTGFTLQHAGHEFKGAILHDGETFAARIIDPANAQIVQIMGMFEYCEEFSECDTSKDDVTYHAPESQNDYYCSFWDTVTQHAKPCENMHEIMQALHAAVINSYNTSDKFIRIH